MVSLVASARVHGFEKVAVTFFFAPHALAREPIEQKTWKLECPSALPCSIFPQNLTKIVGSVQLLCNSLEIEAIKRPMRTSIHFIHYPVLKIYLYLTWVPSGRNQQGLSAIANVEAPKSSDFGIPISRLVNHWLQRQCSCQLLPASTKKNTSSDKVLGIRPTCTRPTHHQHLKSAAQSAVS